jgi:hypothetical protein
MQFFLLGLAALVLALFLISGFTRANPAVLARQVRLVGGALALAVAAVLLVRGASGPATLLGMLGAWLLGWGSMTGTGPSRKSPGQSSTVTTEHLSMELDHDTGAMAGRVLKGMFAGRDLDTSIRSRPSSSKPISIASIPPGARTSPAGSGRCATATAA